MNDALEQRLRRLGVVRGLGGLRPEQGGGEGLEVSDVVCDTSASILPGREVCVGEGTFWLLERRYEPDYVHGCYRLGELPGVSKGVLATLAVPDLGPYPAFLDTETTGLAGGTGTFPFLIGAGVWDGYGLQLNLIFMRSPEEEASALAYLEQVLQRATGLVTFNGMGFDVPILRTRFILNRMLPGIWMLPHLDLLRVARQLWRDHLPSRRLSELERRILGIERAEEDIPSALIPFLYRQYLETGDFSQITRIFYHNEIDVLSLVSLLVHIARVVEAPDSMGLAPAEWVGLGRVYTRAGDEPAALVAWQKAVSCRPETLDLGWAVRVWSELGRRYKRAGAWEQALSVWRTWAEAVPGATEPLVELAKFHEWHERDLKAALEATDQALRRVAEWPHGMRRLRALSDLEHRRIRLRRKLRLYGDRENDGKAH